MTTGDPVGEGVSMGPDERAKVGGTWRRLAVLAVAVLLAATVGGYLSTQWVQTADDGSTGPAVSIPAGMFRSWPADPAPALVLVLTGQEHGYLQPCGCSRPQLGGLERRYNFLEAVRARGWPVVPLDLGDIAYRKGIDEQALLKYDVAMKAREKMGYAATAFGAADAEMQLIELLARFTLQNPAASPKVLGSNLLERDARFPGEGGNSLVLPWAVVPATDKSPAVGVVAAVGPTVAGQIKDPMVRFGKTADAVTAALTAIHAKAPEMPVRVLLYQGTLAEAQSACTAFPGTFHVVLALSQQEEPPAEPVYLDAKGKPGAKAGDAATLVVSVGHKGRHLGVVGFYKSGNGYAMHYELATMGEEFETPDPRRDGHPVGKLMEGYAKDLQKGQFLAKQVKKPHPTQTALPTENVTYIGSERCQTCHQSEHAHWSETKHSHAYENLAKAKHPSLRQYDNQCVVCHTVGFDYQGGYQTAEQTPHLAGVGCESCHGPGSAHVSNPQAEKYRMLMSPWKTKADDRLPDKGVLTRIDAVCQKCHDTDNDPHFRFEQYWPKVNHSGLKKSE